VIVKKGHVANHKKLERSGIRLAVGEDNMGEKERRRRGALERQTNLDGRGRLGSLARQKRVAED